MIQNDMRKVNYLAEDEARERDRTAEAAAAAKRQLADAPRGRSAKIAAWFRSLFGRR